MRLSHKLYAKLSLGRHSTTEAHCLQVVAPTDYSDCRFAHLHIGFISTFSPLLWVQMEAECHQIDGQNQQAK